MSSETWSTLGEQKESNYALRQDMSKEEFIAEVTDGLQAPPQYFPKNAKLNKIGYDSYDEVIKRGTKALNAVEFKQLAEQEDVLVLDVRDKAEFVKGFIPNSWFIGLDGSFAPWVGTLVKDIMQKILLVCPEGREEETVKRLARVGYDQSIGYLKGGITSWLEAGEATNTINTIDAETFLKQKEEEIDILDVRKPGEWETKHIKSAQHFALDFIHENMADFNPNKSYYIHCRSGYRSTVAASILMQRGYSDFVNVQCTFDELSEADLTMAGSCPSLIK